MGQIKVTKASIEGLYVIEPAVHGDERGYFMETYNLNDMKEAGLNLHFVQDNQSMSTKGVLRGLHFQKQYPQGKLVRSQLVLQPVSERSIIVTILFSVQSFLGNQRRYMIIYIHPELSWELMYRTQGL